MYSFSSSGAGIYIYHEFTLLQALIDRHYIAMVTKDNEVENRYFVSALKICSKQCERIFFV